MKINKKAIFLCLFLTVVVLFSINKTVLATNEIQYKQIEYTKEYQEWLALSEEEKKNVLMPRMYEIPKTDSITVNENSNLKANTIKKFSLKSIIPSNTKIKNQASTNSCWAFASLAALETNLAVQDYYNGIKEKVYDFSERHVEYALTREFKNNQINKMGYNRRLDSGGNTNMVVTYLTNGTGAIAEKDMPFENNSQKIELSKIQNKSVITKLYDAVEFPSYEVTEDTTLIKQQIKNHIQTKGGVTAGIYGGWGSAYYNDYTGAIYCDNKAKCPIDHEVLIIGWDDTYKVENFSSSHRPKKPGAWIIKNSWGTDTGDNGFYYVSYEDVNIYYDLNGIEKASTKIDHNNIYQYNELGYDLIGGVYGTKIYLANEFQKKTKGVEYLTEVALNVPEAYTCKVYVNVNGTSKSKKDLTQVKLKEGNSETFEAGYHTIEFANPIQIVSNNFVVVVEIQGKRKDQVTFCLEGKTPYSSMFDYVETQNKKCFIAADVLPSNDTSWVDLAAIYNSDSTIKAFTVNGKEIPNVNYRTHVQNIGWQGYVKNGAISGTSGKSLRLEGIKIKLTNNEYGGDITYRTHVQNVGWQDWMKNDAMSGTSGKSLRLEAIQIKLTGEIANHYDIYYRVHCQEFGWMDWAKNGESAGSAGYSYRLEAIEIKLVKKGGKAPGSTTKPFAQTYISYQTHVQNVGWQTEVKDKETSGTSGKSLRLEGIKIKLENQLYDGNVEYATHVQNIGWQKAVKNGTMSGTSGKALRLEAIRIKLTGTMAEKYDIYYRVHAQNFGWMGWAKNGASAGTAGYSYRLEAIQICLVEKGGKAPGSTANSFRSK